MRHCARIMTRRLQHVLRPMRAGFRRLANKIRDSRIRIHPALGCSHGDTAPAPRPRPPTQPPPLHCRFRAAYASLPRCAAAPHAAPPPGPHVGRLNEQKSKASAPRRPRTRRGRSAPMAVRAMQCRSPHLWGVQGPPCSTAPPCNRAPRPLLRRPPRECEKRRASGHAQNYYRLRPQNFVRGPCRHTPHWTQSKNSRISMADDSKDEWRGRRGWREPQRDTTEKCSIV